MATRQREKAARRQEEKDRTTAGRCKVCSHFLPQGEGCDRPDPGQTALADAKAILDEHAQRLPAEPVMKASEFSAVANAENNMDIVGKITCMLQKSYADQGPTLKRFRPARAGQGDANSQENEPYHNYSWIEVK